MDVFTLATCSPSLFLRSSRHGQLQQSVPHSLSTSSFMMQPLLIAHQDNRQLKTRLVPLPNMQCYLDDVNGENGAVRKLRGSFITEGIMPFRAKSTCEQYLYELISQTCLR